MTYLKRGFYTRRRIVGQTYVRNWIFWCFNTVLIAPLRPNGDASIPYMFTFSNNTHTDNVNAQIRRWGSQFGCVDDIGSWTNYIQKYAREGKWDEMWREWKLVIRGVRSRPKCKMSLEKAYIESQANEKYWDGTEFESAKIVLYHSCALVRSDLCCVLAGQYFPKSRNL